MDTEGDAEKMRAMVTLARDLEQRSEIGQVGGDKATAKTIAQKIKARCDDYASGKRGVGNPIPEAAVVSALDALYHDIMAFAASLLDAPESRCVAVPPSVNGINERDAYHAALTLISTADLTGYTAEMMCKLANDVLDKFTPSER